MVILPCSITSLPPGYLTSAWSTRVMTRVMSQRRCALVHPTVASTPPATSSPLERRTPAAFSSDCTSCGGTTGIDIDLWTISGQMATTLGRILIFGSCASYYSPRTALSSAKCFSYFSPIFVINDATGIYRRNWSCKMMQNRKSEIMNREYHDAFLGLYGSHWVPSTIIITINTTYPRP